MVSHISIEQPSSCALISSTSPILFHPSTFEPFLPLPAASSASSHTPSTLPDPTSPTSPPAQPSSTIPPPRPSSSSCRLRLEPAVARTKDALEDADGVTNTWIKTRKLAGYPFQARREVLEGEDSEDRFVGDLPVGVHRESSVLPSHVHGSPEGDERDLAIVRNQ